MNSLEKCREYALYLLAGLLYCGLCDRPMEPAPNSDGSRAYWCGPGCVRGPIAAPLLEADVLLPAFVRAYHVLYSVGRPIEHSSDDKAVAPGFKVVFKGPTPWLMEDTASASADELRRWQHTDLSNRRAVVQAAYRQVVMHRDGRVQRYWRHEAD